MLADMSREEARARIFGALNRGAWAQSLNGTIENVGRKVTNVTQDADVEGVRMTTPTFIDGPGAKMASEIRSIGQGANALVDAMKAARSSGYNLDNARQAGFSAVAMMNEGADIGEIRVLDSNDPVLASEVLDIEQARARMGADTEPDAPGMGLRH